MAIVNLGKASATQYRLILDKLPISASTIHDLDVLRLNIFNVNLPGISLDNSQMSWQGKKALMHQGGINFDPLNISFIVDNKFFNWKILFKWLTSIANNKDIASSIPKEYVTDGALVILDNWDDVLFKIIFRNIWIQNLGELTFSIRDGETQIECTASFLYDRYEIEE